MKFSILATLLLSSVWSVAGAPLTEPDTNAVDFDDNHETNGNTAVNEDILSPTVKPPSPAVVVRDDQRQGYHYKCTNMTSVIPCVMQSMCAQNGTIITSDQHRCGLEAGCTCELTKGGNPGLHCPPKPVYGLTCENNKQTHICLHSGVHCSTNGTMISPLSVLPNPCGKEAGCGCKKEKTPWNPLCPVPVNAATDTVQDKQVEAPVSVVTRDIEAADSSEWRYKCKDPAHQIFCEDRGAYCSQKQPIWHDGGEPTCGVDGGCGCVQANWPDDDNKV